MYLNDFQYSDGLIEKYQIIQLNEHIKQQYELKNSAIK